MNIRSILNLNYRLPSREAVTLNPSARIKAGKAAQFFIAVIRYFLLIGLSFVILYPLLYMLSVSFRTPEDLYDPTVVWLPRHFTLDNFKFVFFESDIAFLPSFKEGFQTGSMLRSFLLSFSCTALQVFTCALTGYGFARFKFKGRGILFAVAILTLIVPPQSINMPLYVIYTGFTKFTAGVTQGEGFKIIDTFIPMSVPAVLGMGLRSGLFVYLFRQFFKNMPKELEEAAYLDGCGPINAYFKIMLINAGPILIVTFLFSFVWYWNDYMNVSLFFNSARPMSLEVANFRNYLNHQKLPDGSAFSYALMGVYVQVAALLFITPALFIYIVMQKYFMKSIISSGIVG